ncbi:hypothetical protein Dimus_020597 [Dionaea muscipula]
MDMKEKRWAVPNGAKKWVLQTIGVLWRNYKGRLKRDHYTPYETTKMRWKNRPEDVPDEDFKFLLKKWKDPKYKASTRNESSSINVPNELLESIKVDVIAQVITELIANMMQTRYKSVAQHLCSSVSFHSKQINPLIDIDPNCPHEIKNYNDRLLVMLQVHQIINLLVGLNGDSSIGANKPHCEVPFAVRQYLLSVCMSLFFIYSIFVTFFDVSIFLSREESPDDDEEEDDEEEDDDVIDRLQ